MKHAKHERKPFSIQNDDEVPNRIWADKEEKKYAKKTNAIRQPNSGATPYRKGDIVQGDMLLDMKSTKGTQVAITVGMLEKLESDARSQTKRPGLLLNFLAKGTKLLHRQWLLLPVKE